MPSRKLLLAAPLLLLAAILAACGGGDDDGGSRGQLSDPNNVPTASPWQIPPAVLVIDPNNIQPLPPDNDGGTDGGDEGGATPEPGEPGVCGQTYTVIAQDTTFGIADKCGVTVEGIQELNPDIDIGNLSIGDVLIMPSPEPEATEEAQ